MSEQLILPDKDRVWMSVRQYTKSGPERVMAMFDALRSIDERKIEGDVVECGVWRGGNIILARRHSPDRVCWLYDTFVGMTAPTEEDVKFNGKKASDSYYGKLNGGGKKWAAASVEEVRSNLFVTKTLDDSKLRFVVGDVLETLKVKKNLPKKIALLRLDTDWYRSTKKELEVLYPLLQDGGILIVDDYGHWRGAKQAVNQYFKEDERKFTQIDYTAISMVKGQC